MSNKQINELTEKSTTLVDDDLLLVYDSEEAGSEKTKKVAISNYVATINSNLNLYVATTGSDITGDGSSGNPWATPNGALDYLNNKFITPSSIVMINIADGTYNMTSSINFRLQAQNIQFIGNSLTPANVTFNFATGLNGFAISRPGYLYITGIKAVGFARAEFKSGMFSSSNSFLILNNCIVDNFGVGIQGQVGGMTSANNCTGNNCEFGAFAYSMGRVYFNGGTLSNSTWGAVASQSGRLISISTTYSGNSNGTTFTSDGGIIDVV